MSVNIDDVSGDINIPGLKTGNDFSSYFGKVRSARDLMQIILKSIRPWMEFLNINNFKTAASMPRLSSRFKRNLIYFQSNYILIFIVLFIYCLITSPLILIVLAGVAYLCHTIHVAATTFTVFGRSLTTKQQYIMVNLLATPVLYLAGAGAAVFWTTGASCFVIFLHAAFYNIEAIVTEEDTESLFVEVV